MKKSLNSLPENKRKELKIITKRLQEVPGVEKIILFGSYGRGDWVEEPGQDGYYKYQSDFDLLVIVSDKSLAKEVHKWDRVEESVAKNSRVKTPVCVIMHSIQYVNQMLSEGQYFFSDIVKEGILLFDSKKFVLAERKKERSLEEYKNQAEMYFSKWFTSANDFLDTFEYAFKKRKYLQAAFLLHQAVERYYTTILLVFTTYKPKTHDIEKLGKMAAACVPYEMHNRKLITVFPLGTLKERRVYKLLKKAYVDARYNEDYSITEKELQWLAKRSSRLQKLTESICKRKIKSFVGK